MTDENIQELVAIINSIKLSEKLHKGFHKSTQAAVRCLNFCNQHNIKVTHGSPYKELRHKYYYYTKKCYDSIIDKGIDLYNLRSSGLVSDKDIVNYLLERFK